MNSYHYMLQAADLIRRQGDKPLKEILLAGLGKWAQEGYLFVSVLKGKVLGVAVGGPVTAEVLNDKGARTTPEDFDLSGKRLYCFYALMEKRKRNSSLSRQCIAQMLKAAQGAYPQCNSIVWARALRGDKRLREFHFKTVNTVNTEGVI